MNSSEPRRDPWPDRWQSTKAGVLQAYHRYATWLVSISWRRFLVLSVLLIVIAAITQQLPPFSVSVTETVDEPIETPDLPDLPVPPKAPKAPREPVIKIDKPKPGAGDTEGLDISIDERGIRITPRAASAAAPSASAASGISITLPPGTEKEAVRAAVEEARQAIRDATEAQRAAAEDAADAAHEAQQQAREAVDEARRVLKEALPGMTRKVKRTRVVHWGDFLTDLALIWIFGSAIIKITYKGRIQAEVKAAQATETAEAESLKRQVVEARMAAMQAQVEPHFLFNTLASIDHLIETDPPRASQMQKNLIALLRASMPTMREANASGVRDLGRELAVIRPYLEILKVRMEERLVTEIDVPEGLQSAEFPPMMIQSLVENAIKHGLEPKAEGGSLRLKAEILHGKLAVSVADTGLGFGRAATAGTGVGLANIRERLQLLYGNKAMVAVTENQPTSTVVPMGTTRRGRWNWLLLVLLVVAAAGFVSILTAIHAVNPMPMNISIDGEDVVRGLDLASMPAAHKVVFAGVVLMALLAALVVLPVALLIGVMALLLVALVVVGLPLLAAAMVVAIALSPLLLVVWLLWRVLAWSTTIGR